MKKNTNSKKTQEYILDLTDFTVDGSDYAGSYGNFSKFFEDDLEAIRFQQEVMDYISEQVYTGKAKFYLNDSFTTPYAFFPLVLCKHIQLNEFDEDGDMDEDIDEEDLQIIEAYSCVKDISLYHGSYGGTIVKVQLLLSYFTPKNIGSQYYPPVHPKITAYGDMPDALI